MTLKAAAFIAVCLMMEIVYGQSLEEFDDVTEAALGDKLRNYQLLNHTIRTFHQVPSFIQCGIQCVNLAGCKSLNYLPLSGLCELNGVNRLDSPGDLVKGTGNETSYYLDRDSPILMMDESPSCPCCHHSCLNHAFCVPAAPSFDPMSHYRCVCDNGWRGDYCEIMEARWSTWSTWSQCSKTCGKGHRARTRSCQGSNVNSGSCEGVESDYKDCWNNEICAEWASWDDARECSSASSCGYGVVNRTRVCRGEDCVGETTQIDRCRSVSCHVPWRLVGGSSPGHGRLEVYSDTLEEWGTVCSSNWDWEDTVVACRTLGLLPPPGPGSGDVCDPGWLYFGGFCYFFFGIEKKPFYDAQSACDQQSSNLVSILSADEDTFVKGLVLSNHKDIWLGARSDENQEGKYDRPHRWVDGNRMIYDGAMDPDKNDEWGENHKDQECLHMKRDGLWWCVKNCKDTEQFFLCKKAQKFSLRFGPGEGAIHLKDMQCRGCENHLSQCIHSNWHDSESCDHTQDVGLTCVVACPTYQTDGLSNTRFPFRSVDAVSFRVDISIQSAGLVRILLSRSANMPDPVYTISLSVNTTETTLMYHDPNSTTSQTNQHTSFAPILDENKYQDIWISGKNGTISVSTTVEGAPFLEWTGDVYLGQLYVGFESTQEAFWTFKSFCKGNRNTCIPLQIP